MHIHKNQEKCEEHPNHSRRLPKNEIPKTNWPQTITKFNELVDHFVELYKNEQYKDNENKQRWQDKKDPQWQSNKPHNY